MASHVVNGKAVALSDTFQNFYRIIQIDKSVYDLPRTFIEGISGGACEQTERYCRKFSGTTETLKTPRKLFGIEELLMACFTIVTF